MSIFGMILCAILILVAWYIGKPIVGSFWFVARNTHGIPISLSLEQIADLLERYPWCDNQNPRFESVPMFEAPPQPRIYLNLTQGDAELYIEDGRICGEMHTTNTSESNLLKVARSSSLEMYEINQVLKYIICLADPNLSDNTKAEQIKEKSKQVFEKRVKAEETAELGDSLIGLGGSFLRTCGSLLRYCAYALIAGMVIFLIFSLQKHPVDDLKGIVFEDYRSITLGEAVEKYVSNEEWDKEKIDDTHYRVTLSGFIPKEYANISITFDVNYVDDNVYASAREFEWNDSSYDNGYMISQALEAIYGGNPWLL